jgi:hypothetical protein
VIGIGGGPGPKRTGRGCLPGATACQGRGGLGIPILACSSLWLSWPQARVPASPELSILSINLLSADWC